MKLKSFGCSFIFGSDLADTLGKNYGFPSKTSWPALLAKRFELDYECHANPGAGNLQILEQILTHSVDNQPSVFVVGWTWIDRFDYHYMPEPDLSHDHSKWETIRPSMETSLSRYYFKDLQCEFRDKLTSLVYIKTAIDVLQQKNIPFVMTYMDPLLFERKWHVSPAVLDLQNYVRPYMTMFDHQTFLEWSRSLGYAESANWHPLEQAHQAAADIMLTVFDKQKTNTHA
jgi:hypothetical protein